MKRVLAPALAILLPLAAVALARARQTAPAQQKPPTVTPTPPEKPVQVKVYYDPDDPTNPVDIQNPPPVSSRSKGEVVHWYLVDGSGLDLRMQISIKPIGQQPNGQMPFASNPNNLGKDSRSEKAGGPAGLYRYTITVTVNGQPQKTASLDPIIKITP